MNITTAASRIYIVELSEPFERLEFQFVPENINWQRLPNIQNVPIVGRNNSKHQYTGGEDVLRFALKFNSMFEDDKRIAIKQFAFLRSLAMNDGFAGPARNVKLVWGDEDYFRHLIWVVKLVDGNLGHFHSEFGMSPLQIGVEIALELDPVENSRLRDVRL